MESTHRGTNVEQGKITHTHTHRYTPERANTEPGLHSAGPVGGKTDGGWQTGV